ncbi:hypothetical protein K0M31_017948 [Melipona bicolor]|uniref:Uncharacterized protein n=1 Tax=Melipona bicolor TaxID=60889 RepID=A0AA40G6M9_9HYME|nr:hypothetical protein K0M31_017948 [Melipona bicolor]
MNNGCPSETFGCPSFHPCASGDTRSPPCTCALIAGESNRETDRHGVRAFWIFGSDRRTQKSRIGNMEARRVLPTVNLKASRFEFNCRKPDRKGYDSPRKGVRGSARSSVAICQRAITNRPG